MENNQDGLKALLQEKDCVGVPANEEYQEYLVDYLIDENFFENELADYCVFPIGYNQSIVYIKSKNPLTGDDRRFRYDTVPKCYGLMASEELEETGILKVRRSPQLGYRGSGILIGIIDTGIRLEESLFLYEDGSSKVVSLWDQSNQSGIRPEGFLYGTEWTREEISEGIKKKDKKLPGDENGHGTFLAAVAAGREDIDKGFSGVAPDAELVVVKLKQSKKYLREFYSIPDGIWSCQEDDVMLAVRYVISVANKLGRPVSICLGIGTNLGGHNGANGLARYISYLSLLPRISFHIAGGNEGISGQVVHLIGTVKQGVQNISVHQLAVCGVVHPAGNEPGFRRRLIFQRHIPAKVFMVPFPTLPVPVQLVPFLHHVPEILLGTGSFLQPPYGLGLYLPFQSLSAGQGCFFFLVFQLRFVINGMLVLLQLTFHLGPTFFRKRLFQRFFRCFSACLIVPSGDVILGIQKLIIKQIRHDHTSFQKIFCDFSKMVPFCTLDFSY